MSHQRRRANLTLLAAAAVWGTTAAHADSPWLYGIHWYGDPATSQVEAMTGGKGIWCLEIVETNSDIWWGAAWQRDNRFNAMISRGHTLIVRIERNWGETVPYDGHLSEYLGAVTASAQALADVCHIWQIGNEMNLYGEWGGNALTPAAYINMYRQIRAAIHAVPSSLGPQVVLLGPVSPGEVVGGVRHTSGSSYLAQMCALLDPDEIDGFALHAYAAPWNDAVAARAELQAGYASQLAIIDAAGFYDKTVHITEWNRRVDNPGNAAAEAQSAQFLHGAFADLDSWNSTPGNHPVSSAEWFIYDDSPGWEQYSILHMLPLNPRGADADLWDAFQFACTQDYPAGTPDGFVPVMVDGAPLGANVAAESAQVTTDSNFNADNTGAMAIDGIVDAGSKWTSAGSVPPHWLELDSGVERLLSGIVVRHAGAGGEPGYFNTEAFRLETRVTDSDLWRVDSTVYNDQSNASTLRRYLAPRAARFVRLFISDPGIDNYARIPEFEVYAAVPGDFDLDNDRDMLDVAAMQNCWVGCGACIACFPAHQNGDETLDSLDVQEFLSRLSGPVE